MDSASDDDEYQGLIDVVCNESCYKLSCINTINSLSDWDIEKMQSYHFPNSIIDFNCDFSFGDKIPKGATPVTPAMMLHHFPIPLNGDRVQLCECYDSCPA